MLKIKSSILLLISIVLLSCAQNYQNNKNQKFSIAYIGGEFDGLLLKNFLTSHLDSLNIYLQFLCRKVFQVCYLKI